MIELCALDARECTDRALVGGKAAALAILKSRGQPVPPGFVVTAPALGGSVFRDELGSAISAAVEHLPAARFAVRTSAVAEDLAERSFAGLYETQLRVDRAGLIEAIKSCSASRDRPLAAGYASASEVERGVAVLVQEMVESKAHGIAFTADPLTGARDEVIIVVEGTASSEPSWVPRGRGTPGPHAVGARSTAAFEQWRVRGSSCVCSGGDARVLEERDALLIAALAREVEAVFGEPRDVEWAIDARGAWVLQARPITRLPKEVEWPCPAPGGFLRAFRLGEWMASPVTPAMETWVLGALARGASEFRRYAVGLPLPDPAYVLVHGWCFSSVNYLPSSASGIASMLARLAAHALIHPRRASVMFLGALGRPAEAVYQAYWKEEMLPRYRDVVRRGELEVSTSDVPALIALVDRVAEAAGEYYGSVSGVIGLAWKSELLLAELCRDHLNDIAPADLLLGLRTTPLPLSPHAVVDLDISHPTAGELDLTPASPPSLIERRQNATARAQQQLANKPKLLRRFESLLGDAQRLAPLRQEAILDLTLGWPLIRQALFRIANLQKIPREDLFFYRREEITTKSEKQEIAERRAAHRANARLIPPASAGELPAAFSRAAQMAEAFRIPGAPGSAVLQGAPASPGRAIGRAYVVRDERDFADFPTGAILIARATPPAWFNIFAKAAAVVTETGTVLSHSSVLAREYGLPAVVGLREAATKIPTGLLLAVDGGRGTVTIA